MVLRGLLGPICSSSFLFMTNQLFVVLCLKQLFPDLEKKTTKNKHAPPRKNNKNKNARGSNK